MSPSRLSPQAAKARLTSLAKRLLRRSNWTLSRYDHRFHPLARRMRLIADRRIDLVFDVGANNGGYATGLRELGYAGRIVSFEPLADAFTALAHRSGGDDRWSAICVGLGETEGSATLHVAGNSESSSLLPMLPLHEEILPSSGYVRSETIQIITLDTAITEYARPGERLFVKLDAQGFERHILEGARRLLPRVLGFQLEMSLTPLYEGEWLMPETVNYLRDRGYDLMSLEPGFADAKTGRLLQVDGIFFRPD